MSGHAAAKPRSFMIPALSLTLVVGLLLMSFSGSAGAGLSPGLLYHHLAWPFAKLVMYLGVGLFIGQLLESLGWSARIGRWVQPLIRWGRFGPQSAAAFSASFFSGLVANTMLMSAYQEGTISRRELTLSYLLNTGLPGFVLHLPTTFFILVPLTRRAGLIYLGLTGLAALLRSMAVMFYARSVHGVQEDRETVPAEVASGKVPGWGAIWRKFRRRFVRLISYTMPIYVLIFLAQQAGWFEVLRQGLAGLVSVGFFPLEAASVVIFSVATEFSSGAAAAGALLSAGALTVPQTVAALMLGSIVATPVRAVRHQLPTHVGIFAPRLGTRLLVTSQGLRIVSLIVVTLPYLWWS